MEDPREIQTDSWRKRREMEEPSSPQALCHLVPPGPGPERSGCETPVSVDSIPLEWDHTGDVGGSSSHEDDEEGPYYSALSGKRPGYPETLRPCGYVFSSSQHSQLSTSGSPAMADPDFLWLPAFCPAHFRLTWELAHFYGRWDQRGKKKRSSLWATEAIHGWPWLIRELL